MTVSDDRSKLTHKRFHKALAIMDRMIGMLGEDAPIEGDLQFVRDALVNSDAGIRNRDAEIERLTAERDAAVEEAREMTVRFDAVNSAACAVVDSYFGVTVDSEAEMFELMKDLRDATVDDGRTPQPAAPAQPQPTAAERMTTLSFRADTPMWAIDLLNADHYFKQGNEHRALETIIDYLKCQAGYEALASWAEFAKVVPMKQGETQS